MTSTLKKVPRFNAKGYDTFYTDYFGADFVWDYETEVGII